MGTEVLGASQRKCTLPLSCFNQNYVGLTNYNKSLQNQILSRSFQHQSSCSTPIDTYRHTMLASHNFAKFIVANSPNNQTSFIGIHLYNQTGARTTYTVSFVMSVCLSVAMEQLFSKWKNFLLRNLMYGYSSKICGEKFKPVKCI